MAEYSEYKNSGIPWIGKIPSHWDVKPIRSFLSQSKELNENENATLLTLSQYKGVNIRNGNEDSTISAAESLVGYNVVHKGQFVMNIMLAWNGSYGVSDYDGVISPAYAIFNFKNDVCKAYYHYLWRTKAYQDAFKTRSKGIVDSRLRLYPQYFLPYYTSIPPKDEQEAIVAYLDKITADIDKAIEAKERIIASLEERRKIIITHAVTRGINPDVPMRDSGIEWLGEIPAHWETIPVRHFFEFRNGYTPSKANNSFWTNGTIPWFRMEDIRKSGRFLNKAIQYITPSALNNGGTFEAGSFILAICTASQTSMLEVELEKLIERTLTGSTREERHAAASDMAAEPLEPYGPNNGFLPGESDEMKPFDKAINTVRLWSFLNKTQKSELDKWRGRGELRAAVEKEIDRKLNTKGILDTLRQPLEVDNITLYLYYTKPSPSDSEQSHRDYGANEWSVTRQQRYSKYHPGNEIDMVVFINGIPLFTIELKNPSTHQTARYDGQKQYREDRDPRDTLLKFGRCLAHFTLDKDEVFFTTKLEGKNTFFMPFNQGLPNGQGAGNPINPNGHKTAYFWERILTPDTLSDIIQNFALVDYGEAKKHKKVPHLLKNAKGLILPRFHQLDVVNKLREDASSKGVGEKYLIQHSAGSGKSNSITWLAFDLIKACPATLDAKRSVALDKQLFQSVIIVTDRRVLDSQIYYNVWAFAKSDKIIAHADTSEQLRKAIEGGKRIIITTIQKFPYICGAIADMSNRNFAVIIDEAHSSQSGIAADKLNATTYRDPDVDQEDTDSIIEKLIAERKMSPNTSYFAFTATPKPNTLERFGIPNEEGGFDPFHLYSMKQAIEEGFILDVLSNYTTYTSYYELAKSIQDNPKYDETKAQKRLRRKVERDPRTIKEKAEVIINHFDAKVFRARKLKGQAKAMVVTRDIECAIRYFQAINKTVEEQRLPYKPIIAFSGEKTVDGITYTEAGINGFPDAQTPEKLDGNDYQILVVANKYLTGFDQEKLCSMYIDKPLAGVLAVQALSRLNRISPKLGKSTEDLAVIDFYNKIDDMKNAFDDFFTCTSLSEPTNINILHDLRTAILDAGVFTEEEEVAQLNELFQHGAGAHELSPILDACVERFDNEIEWNENGKPDFKIKCKQFVKVYSRVAAILPFENVKWEKLYWFLRQLIPLLKVQLPNEDDLSGLQESVDMNTYALRRTATNKKIELDAAATVLDPNSPNMAGAGTDEPSKSPLDTIIANFNERWFSGWDAPADERRIKMYRVAREIINTPQYQNQIVGNPDRDEADAAFNRIVDTVMRRMRRSDDSLYREYNQNEGFQGNFRNLLRQIIDDQDYREVVENTDSE